MANLRTRWSGPVSPSRVSPSQQHGAPGPVCLTACSSTPPGVADQLQTNYASDLRSILKTLFEVMATKPETDDKEKLKKGECQLRTCTHLQEVGCAEILALSICGPTQPLSFHGTCCVLRGPAQRCRAQQGTSLWWEVQSLSRVTPALPPRMHTARPPATALHPGTTRGGPASGISIQGDLPTHPLCRGGHSGGRAPAGSAPSFLRLQGCKWGWGS